MLKEHMDVIGIILLVCFCLYDPEDALYITLFTLFLLCFVKKKKKSDDDESNQ